MCKGVLADIDRICHERYYFVMDPMADLTTMNVSLRREQKQFVEEQVARTGCSTVSEYVRRLIHEDQLRQERELLDHKLLEAMQSGPDVEMTAEDWAEIRAAARARLKNKSRGK